MLFIRPVFTRLARQQRTLVLGNTSGIQSGRITCSLSTLSSRSHITNQTLKRCQYKYTYETCQRYSTTPLSLKIYEEGVPAAEQEQEITRAQSVAETGTEKAYNNLLHKLNEAVAQLANIQNDPTSNEHKIIKSMRNVATMQWDLGMMEQAQNLQEEILSNLIQKHSKSTSTSSASISGPPQHLDIAITMHTIGSIQSRLQNPREASKWFDASLAMKTDLLSSKYSYHFEIGKTLNGLALVKMQLNQEEGIHTDTDPLEYVRMLEEAESHYIHHGETLEDDEEQDGQVEGEEDMSHHPHVASLDENIAMIYRKHGDLKMACQRYENALRIREHWENSSSTEGNEHIMSLNMHIGDCLQGMELYEEAMERYKKALEQHLLVVKREKREEREEQKDENEDDGSLVEYSRKEATAMTGILRHSIGLMHAHLSNYEEAMHEYQEALEIKRGFGSDHPEVAKTLNAIAALLATKGEGQTAMSHLREALRIFKLLNATSEGGEVFDEDVIQTQNNIELVEKSLGGGSKSGGRGGTIIS